MNNDTKVCRLCQKEKPLSEFYKHSSAKDGLHSECIHCYSSKRGHTKRFIAPDGMKRCTTCKQVLPATNEYFRNDRTSKDELQSSCTPCQKEMQRVYLESQKDTEEYKARNRANAKRWRENDPERAKQSHRQHYLANRDSIINRQRIYIRTHQAQKREQSRRWVQANPQKRKEISRASVHRRRAQKQGLPDNFTSQDWENTVNYFHGCCAVCGRQGNDLLGTHTLAADHWIPLSSPDCPGTIPTNIIPLCHGVEGCNNSKSNKHPLIWLTEKFGKRRASVILQRIQAYFDSLTSY